jgi:hypothetical protein
MMAGEHCRERRVVERTYELNDARWDKFCIETRAATCSVPPAFHDFELAVRSIQPGEELTDDYANVEYRGKL